MTKSLAMMVAMGAFTSFAGVARIGEQPAPTIDGRLDESCWQGGGWETGFKPKRCNAKAVIGNQTFFRFAKDARNVYLAVKCEEQDMKALKAEPAKSIWQSDQLNVFLSPSGSVFDFYQFALTANHGLKYQNCYSEGGNISAEAGFAPAWEYAIGEWEKGWTAEVRIPLAAFYLTKGADWKEEWLVNVCRKRTVGESEISSWAEVDNTFNEPKNMRAYGKFPKRHMKDAMTVTDVQFVPSGLEGGKIAGRLDFALELANQGEFEISSSASAETKRAKILKGVHRVHLPATFAANGRFPVEIAVNRVGWGEARRSAKVKVEFTPVVVTLSTPAYRNNFYPGQDSSKVVGEVTCAQGGAVKVTLAGAGLGRLEQSLAKPGRFAFDTSAMTVGEATLTVTCADGETKAVVRKLAPSGHRMAWIENGNVVVDGKPLVSRRLAHPGYRTGARLDELLLKGEMHETLEVGEASIEPGRLVKGCEPREMTKDQPPSAEVLAAVDAQLAAMKDKDFAFWYVCDEPECRGISSVYLRHVYEYIAAKDPYHLIRIGTRAPLEYMKCCDWMETHPYINPMNQEDGTRTYGRPISEVGDFVECVSKLGRKDKCIGFYTTGFAYTYKNPKSDYPTFDEYLCHAWAGTMRGARTLIVYAAHDIADRASVFEGTKYMFTSLEALSPFVLADRRRTLVRTKAVEAVEYAADAAKMFVLVNLSAEPQTVTLDKLSEGEFIEFRGNRTFTAATSFSLRPFESVVGVTDRAFGAGLATLADVRAGALAAEAARVKEHGLLVGHWQQVEVRASTKRKRFNPYKLMDGATVQFALGDEYTKEKFVELRFKDGFRPVFSKAKVYGANLQGAKAFAEIDGAWREIGAGVESGKYLMTFDFAKPIAATSVKFVFAAKKFELYETELHE